MVAKVGVEFINEHKMRQKIAKLGASFLQHFPSNLCSTLGSKQKMTQHLIALLKQHIASISEEYSLHVWSTNNDFSFPVKLLVCELFASDEHKQMRNWISPLVNMTNDAPKFGIFHTGMCKAFLIL